MLSRDEQEEKIAVTVQTCHALPLDEHEVNQDVEKRFLRNRNDHVLPIDIGVSRVLGREMRSVLIR